MHQIRFRPGPDPLGSLQRSARTPSLFKGTLLGSGEEGRERGRPPNADSWIRPRATPAVDRGCLSTSSDRGACHLSCRHIYTVFISRRRRLGFYGEASIGLDQPRCMPASHPPTTHTNWMMNVITFVGLQLCRNVTGEALSRKAECARLITSKASSILTYSTVELRRGYSVS